ncbi:MAG: hypothetical protein WA485_17865 [Candidatus Sulfotelmatobacter sp.]
MIVGLRKAGLQKSGYLLATLLTIASLAVFSFAASKTYTGTVSDAMCGKKHMGDAATCTRACISKGSKYALVVGDKVYTLEATDKASLDTLDKQAGAKATVSGTEKDDVITVSSVKAAK